MTTPAPPGWYVDPANPALESWWNGIAYTHSRPRTDTAPADASAAPHPTPAYLAVPAPARPRPAGVSPKSRTVAAILGFFLGALGIHRFYLGNIGLGIALLVIGPFTGLIWNLIDWIIVLAGAAHDGENLPVTEWS